MAGAMNGPPVTRRLPRLLYVVTEDWYFLSHRLAMARAAREAGFEVHVATRVVDGRARIQAEGFTLHPIPFVRGRMSPAGTLAAIRALRRVHAAISPTIAHHVALQASVLGSLATLGRPVARVNALTGFGYAFTSNRLKARFIRRLIGALLRPLFDRHGSVTLVQNPDDRSTLLSLGFAPERIALIAGSGVEVDRFKPTPEPEGIPTAAFVGRLLDDKGIRVLVAAMRLLRARGSQAALSIAGTPDPANPTSVPLPEVESWNREPGIKWLGNVDDIPGLWTRAHIAVLPSRREGLPKALLEAAACGRPMIAADVPGSREIVIPGKTGLLVPVDDAPALADAIEALAADAAMRASFGDNARRLVLERFSDAIVARQIVDLYRSLLAAAAQGESSAPGAAPYRDARTPARDQSP
jgi:glycosyltransferase involved in cell wall biosynthesis